MSARGFAGFDSLEAIQRANRDAGRYFFDPPTMRAFASRISRAYGVRGVIAGRFFITTDRNHDGTARFATIRMAEDDASIGDVGGFLRFGTPAQAARALRAALAVGVRVEDGGPMSCGVYIGPLAVGHTPHMQRRRAQRLAASIRRSSGARRLRCEPGYIDRSGDSPLTVVIDPEPLRGMFGRAFGPDVQAVEVGTIPGEDGDAGPVPVLFADPSEKGMVTRLDVPATAVQVGWRETTPERRHVYGLPPRTAPAKKRTRGRRA